MARGLAPGGRLTSLELDPDNVKIAAANIRGLGYPASPKSGRDMRSIRYQRYRRRGEALRQGLSRQSSSTRPCSIDLMIAQSEDFKEVLVEKGHATNE